MGRLLPFSLIVVFCAVAHKFFRVALRVKDGRRATKEGGDAWRALWEFLSENPDERIDHPQAQRILERKIAAEEKWQEAHPYCARTNHKSHLEFLKSLRAA